jgi:hypothetical protein
MLAFIPLMLYIGHRKPKEAHQEYHIFSPFYEGAMSLSRGRRADIPRR